MQVRAQEVCECQDASLNWSSHTTEPWLQHLRKLYFSTNLIKYKFMQQSIEFLDYIINSNKKLMLIVQQRARKS